MKQKMVFLFLAYLFTGSLLLSVSTGCGQSGSIAHPELLEKRPYSAITAPGMQFIIISDQDHFIEIFNKIHAESYPMPALPFVDFNTHLVLAAFMGQKPTGGYDIALENIALVPEDRLRVTVIATIPTEGAFVPQVLTSPYVLTVIERGAFSSVEFVDEGGHRLKLLHIPWQ